MNTHTQTHPVLTRLGISSDWVRNQFDSMGAFYAPPVELINASECSTGQRIQLRNTLLAELMEGPKTSLELLDTLRANTPFIGHMVRELKNMGHEIRITRLRSDGGPKVYTILDR